MSELLEGPFYPPVVAIEGEVVRRGRTFEVVNLENQLKGLQDGFALQPDIHQQLRLSSFMLRSSSFVERDDWRIGREDSKQGVRFGELLLTLDDASDSTLAVAVKPYPLLQRDRAMHEYGAFEWFREDAHLRSFRPVGFWNDDKGHPHLLTHFEAAVMTLDNIEWYMSAQEPLNENLSVLEALHKSAQILAWMHSLGYTHRDAQIKNMAVDTTSGAVRLVDLTTMQYARPTESDFEAWHLGVANDLGTIVRSILRSGFLIDDAESDRQHVLDTEFMQLYRAMISHPGLSDRMTPEQQKKVRTICKQVLEEA